MASLATVLDSVQDLQPQAAAPQSAAPGMTPVIDVSSTPYSPAIPAGQPGSQLAPTATAGTAPPALTGTPVEAPKPVSSVANKLAITDAALRDETPATTNIETPKPAQMTGYLANVGAGTSQQVAELLGLPVDATTMLLNAGAKALGLPAIQHPFLGSESFEKLFGLIGANPQNVVPADQGERLARAAASGATAVALPGGVASKLVRAGVDAPALASLATSVGPGAATVGAASGVGGEIASELVPDEYKPLAQMMGGVVAGAPVAAAEAGANAALRGVGTSVRRALTPNQQVPDIAGRVIQETVGGVPEPTPAPVPSVKLTTPQVTGSPEAANALDVLNAMDPAAMQRQRSMQNEQMTAPLFGNAPGEPALITETAKNPDVIAARGSTAATEAVRQAAKISNTEERRVWNTPALSKPNVSSQTSKNLINSEISRMRREEPGLADVYDHSGLPAVVRDLDTKPEKIAANELNSISSRFRKIARDPGQDSDVRLIARNLANIAQDGIWQAPEVAGRPETSHVPIFPEPGWARAAADGKPVVTPEIKPDPELVQDLKAARAFTKKEAEVFGHASFDNIMRRNSYGNETATTGTALSRFFDFANGVERPGDIKNVSKFLDNIRSEWMKLSAEERGGTFDPETINPVKAQLEDGARNYLFGKMLDAITSKELDMTGNRQLQYKQAVDWLDSNKDMLERTGLVSPDQMDLLGRWRDTAAMIQRESDLSRTKNSATFTRMVNHPVRFVDLFTGPLVGRAMTAGAGAIMGTFLTRWIGEAAIGGMIGAELGGVGTPQALMQALYAVPRERLLAKLGEAYRDPQIAHDLAMRTNAAAKTPPSEATKAWIRSLLATQPATGAAQ